MKREKMMAFIAQMPIVIWLKKQINLLNIKVFNTLFRKFIGVFAVVLAVSFLVMSIILYTVLGDFAISEKEKIIEANCDYILRWLSNIRGNLYNPMISNLFTNTLNGISDIANCTIFVVGSDGEIYFHEQPGDNLLPADVVSKLKVVNGKYYLPDSRQYSKLMQGSVHDLKEVGDFYGLFKDRNITSWLTYAKPLIIQNNQDSSSQIIGGVYFFTPLSYMSKARYDIFRLFIISVAFSILFAVALIYLFSRRITKPLTEMKHVAKVISQGDFSQRIEVQSNDELGELSNSFNQMIGALQNLEEMRRGFIANVSHELRTPVTSIGGFVEGILDGTIPPENQKKYLTIVRDETKRLTRLVNDFLDLAKIEAGELTITPVRFNIHELIRRCIIKLESQITNKNLSLNANFYEEELFVIADVDSIERVIINLLHNAIKFTEAEGQIEIITKINRDKVLVTVKDDGAGIEEAEMDLIWERFYKTDKSRSKDKSGTGLGLAIVKNILHEHGQEIWVHSKINEGTEFTFSLLKAQNE